MHTHRSLDMFYIWWHQIKYRMMFFPSPERWFNVLGKQINWHPCSNIQMYTKLWAREWSHSAVVHTLLLNRLKTIRSIIIILRLLSITALPTQSNGESRILPLSNQLLGRFISLMHVFLHSSAVVQPFSSNSHLCRYIRMGSFDFVASVSRFYRISSFKLGNRSMLDVRLQQTYTNMHRPCLNQTNRIRYGCHC